MVPPDLFQSLFLENTVCFVSPFLGGGMTLSRDGRLVPRAVAVLGASGRSWRHALKPCRRDAPCVRHDDPKLSAIVDQLT